MSFSTRACIAALAIVKIFETSKPFGDYSACAVLADGAGISYGISQFTHRSGSLALVVEEYLLENGKLHADNLRAFLPQLKNPDFVGKLGKNTALKKMLRDAGQTPEMQTAQRRVMINHYLNPAIEACKGSNFVLPLSLAVVYDSKNQGSYDLIRDRNSQQRANFETDLEFEKAWIGEYVRDRDYWLENHKKPILRETDYRTDFFLAQIARNNWNLDLPMSVHGHRLTEQILFGENAPPLLTEAANVAQLPLEELLQPQLNNVAAAVNSSARETANDVKEGVTESVTATIETASGAVAAATSEAGAAASAAATSTRTAVSFKPEDFLVYLPSVKKLQTILAAITGSSFFAFFSALWAGFSPVVLLLIGFVAGIAFTGCIALPILNYVGLISLRIRAMELQADPLKHNPELVPTVAAAQPFYRKLIS